MQPSRIARIVSLSLAFLLPGAIASADDDTLPPVTPFIDSAPVPPPERSSAADERPPPPPITPFLDSAPIPSRPATQLSRWYGGNIIAADLGTVACFALTQNGVCVIPYFFAGAAVHAFHGQSARAWLSVGLRLYTPVVAAVVGGLIGGCPPPHQEPSQPRRTATENDMNLIGGLYFPSVEVPCDEMIVGALVGAAVGMALDAALGFTPPSAPVADPPARGAVRLAPRLSLGQAHLSLGLSATF